MKPVKKNKPQHLLPASHALLALGGLIVVSVSGALAANHGYYSWETGLISLIYGLPEILRPLWLAITILGSSWMVILLTLGSFIYGFKRLAVKIFANGIITYLAVDLIKNAVARPRPNGFIDGIASREFFSSGYGYPSGHTAMATVLAITLLPYIPKKYHLAAAVVVALVGISRIYLGVHAPLDVIGGAALGLTIASVQQLWSIKRINKKP